MRTKVFSTAVILGALHIITHQGPTFATTYYVAANGSGSLCTVESPCSLNTGLGKLAAGDTLYLRGGTYQQAVSFSRSGTSGSRITISGYPGETAVIDGAYTHPGGSVYRFLIEITANYVTIRDLKFMRSSGSGLVIHGTKTYAINIHGNGTRETGIVAAGDSGLIDGCTMTDNGNGYGSGNQGTWGSAICTIGSNTTIQNCVAYENRGEGIRCIKVGVLLQDKKKYRLSDKTKLSNERYNDRCRNGSAIQFVNL